MMNCNTMLYTMFKYTHSSAMNWFVFIFSLSFQYDFFHPLISFDFDRISCLDSLQLFVLKTAQLLNYLFCIFISVRFVCLLFFLVNESEQVKKIWKFVFLSGEKKKMEYSTQYLLFTRIFISFRFGQAQKNLFGLKLFAFIHWSYTCMYSTSHSMVFLFWIYCWFAFLLLYFIRLFDAVIDFYNVIHFVICSYYRYYSGTEYFSFCCFFFSFKYINQFKNREREREIEK